MEQPNSPIFLSVARVSCLIGALSLAVGAAWFLRPQTVMVEFTPEPLVEVTTEPGGQVESDPWELVERIAVGRTVVVHVWLQGCQDCMPAFEKMRELSRSMDDLETWNVGYGAADPVWAKKFGLDRNLVIDNGAVYVQPLGIGTFTTLVVDGNGKVIHRDRPTENGYEHRVRRAFEPGYRPLANQR